MSDEEKEDIERGLGFSSLITIIVTGMIIVVILGVYQYMRAPFHTADALREKIQDMNVSDSYRQGWLDCVDEYLDMMTKATNATEDVIT